MKRVFLLLAFVLTLLAIPVAGAKAADIFANCGTGSVHGTPHVCNDAQRQTGNNGTNSPIVRIIKTAITLTAYLVGAAGIVGILVSGFRLSTNGGASPQDQAKARTSLVYSLVGIAVAAMALAIVGLVLKNVG